MGLAGKRRILAIILGMMVLVGICRIYVRGMKQLERCVRADVEVVATGGEVQEARLYRLPEGLFHGMYWEFDKDRAFRLELSDSNAFRLGLSNRKRREFDVMVPVEEKLMAFTGDDLVRQWEFTIDENVGAGLIAYDMFDASVGMKLRITLPYKPDKHYSFSVVSGPVDTCLIIFGELTDYNIHRQDRGIFGYAVVKKVDDAKYVSEIFQPIELLGSFVCPRWRLLSWLGLAAAVAVMGGSFVAGIRWGWRNSIGLLAWVAALACSNWNMMIHARVVDIFLGEMFFGFIVYPIFCVWLVRVGSWVRLMGWFKARE